MTTPTAPPTDTPTSVPSASPLATDSPTASPSRPPITLTAISPSSGIAYDFVTGEGGSGQPGLPNEVVDCLAGS
jgi:hypothetical protein